MQDDRPDDMDFIPELLELMPLSASDVLICDGPALARAYRLLNPTARITAIGAADPEIVDAVIDGRVETLPKSRIGGPFDLVVINETLGALNDPARLLGRLSARMRPGGHLVTSYRNDVHWLRMRARLEGKAVSRDALTPDGAAGMLADAGLTLRRVRGHRQHMPAGQDRQWFDGMLQAGLTSGCESDQMESRLAVTHYVSVATRPEEDGSFQKAMRFHQVELAAGMEVRTRIPATALSAEPSLHVTTVFKRYEVPDVGSAGGVLLLQRPRISDPKRLVDYVASCQKRGIVVIVEYDDDPTLVSRVLKRDDTPEIYRRNIALAHAVQTSTASLAEQFRKSNPEVMFFPNVAGQLPPLRQHRAGAVRVLFGALNRSRTAELAAEFAPSIAALPDACFEVVHDRAFFDALPAENKNFLSRMKYDRYLDLMGRCDICLMPLEGLPEELGKSDVKWVEAASRGAIAIGSPAVYEGTIRHGENGFITREPGDWSRLLIELAADPALRNRVAATAWAEVRDSRMMAQQVAARRDWYHDLMMRRDEIFANAIRRSPALVEALAAG